MRIKLLAGVFVLSSTVVAQNQTQLLNVTSKAWPTIPVTCLAVLSQNVTCAPVLIYAKDLGGGMSRFYTDNSLTSLCTASCTSGLATWYRRVMGACANVFVPMSSSNSTLTWVAQWAQEYVEAYNSTCIKDNTGKLCNSVIRGALGINPTNQVQTANASQSAGCNSCVLSVLSTQLAMPLAATDTRIAQMYQAATSKCSVTGWTMPTPAKTTWDSSVSTGASPTPTCAGKSVAVSGQTCQQMSTSNSISTRSLMTANNLSGNCYQFPTSGNLCVPANAVCRTYTVKSSDTCKSIGSANKVSQVQLISWNPELGIDCSNLNSTVGYVICISNPGGDWVNPNPPPPPTTTTFESIPSMAGMVQMTALPQPTRIGWNNSIDVAPYADGTRLDCQYYIQPPVLKDWVSNTTTLACADVAAAYNVALNDLLTWNPSLKTADAGNCSLKTDRQYCVQLGNATVANPNQFCAQFEMAYPGRECAAFVATHGLEMSQFTTWNPAVGSSCENFKTGVTYCVDVYRYRQPGIVSTCNQFVVANDTQWADNPCNIIESKFGLVHARFVAWNPAVQSNCTGLYRNYEYCVSIPGYKPTFSSSGTVTATPRPT